MIKLTLNEALEISKAFPAFPPCAGKAGYALSIVRNKIRSALLPVDEQRRQMIERNGGEIDAAGVIKWASLDGQAAADKEFADYLTMEIEIDREPVSLAAILDMPKDKQPALQPELLSVLEKIIVE
jgi:hypothetical protein